MTTYPFLFWAYNVIWLSLGAYLFFVGTRLRRAERRLAGLERHLERQRSAADGASEGGG
jgi:CcmD family protein